MINEEKLARAVRFAHIMQNRPGANPQPPKIHKSVAEVAEAHALTENEATEALVELGLLYLRDHPHEARKLLFALAIVVQKDSA
jgi:hypothetical protein